MGPVLYDCTPPISEGHKWMQWDAISLYLATTMKLPKSPILIPSFIQTSCLYSIYGMDIESNKGLRLSKNALPHALRLPLPNVVRNHTKRLLQMHFYVVEVGITLFILR
jgi:hypothetical protein